MADTTKPEALKDPAVFDRFARNIVDDQRDRENRRKDNEKVWDEVDRQVAMQYEERVDVDGRPTGNSNWMPELEMPLQAETLEVLCTDARRLMFGTGWDWFQAHAALSDKYLARVEKKPILHGLDIEEAAKVRMNQDAADKITKAALNFYHRRYDFKSRWDEVNAEAFKYGTWAARGLLVDEDKFTYDATGLKASKKKVPHFIPVSIRNLYLDDTPMQALHEGLELAPSFIRRYWQREEDLKLAMMAGKDSAGWLMAEMDNISAGEIDGEHKDHVEILEFEGDFVEKDNDDILLVPNVILTVAVNSGGPKIIRWRDRDLPFRSYLIGHYQKDRIDSAYGSSPLMKGVPLDKAATEALNRTMQAGAINAQPPVSYDPNDWHLMNAGGPRVEPNALWPAMSKPEVHQFGDPAALLGVYAALVKQYQDQSGNNDVRMGQSTQTHKTAFAVNAEQTRGVVRTVDYVDTTLEGSLLSWLNMSFHMIKKALKSETQTVFIDEYQGFVELSGDHLPDDVVFETIGSDGPVEEMQKNQLFMAILKGMAEIEPMVVQMGGSPVDWDHARKEALRRGGVTDTESYFKAPQPMVGQPQPGAQGLPPGAPPGPPVPGPAGVPPAGPAPGP